jgi:hypothetical protein
MRRRARLVPPHDPKRPVAEIEITDDEIHAVNAHLSALDAVWDQIRTMHHLAEDVIPCSHAKAAIRLYLFTEQGGIAPVDRLLFDRARLPLPDLMIEAGPLAGRDDPCAIAAHAATGCRHEGTTPVIRVRPARPTPAAGMVGGAEQIPDYVTATAPGYAWEANALIAYVTNIGQSIDATVKGVGASKCCVHLASAIRRACAQSAPKAAALEVVALARVGMTLPEYRDPAVERWMHIPGDDGTLKAHLDACPLANGPEHWPAVAVATDGASRPVRVPGAHGSELRWPEPVWS